MGAIELAKKPLDAISNHCRAHFSRDSQPEFSTFTFLPGHVANEGRSHPFTPVPKHEFIFAFSGKPLTPWKALWPRHNRLAASLLQRQPLAALSTTTAQHRPSAGGRHTSTKSVRSFAFHNRWLKSTLHRILLFPCTFTTSPPVDAVTSRSPAPGLSMGYRPSGRAFRNACQRQIHCPRGQAAPLTSCQLAQIHPVCASQGNAVL